MRCSYGLVATIFFAIPVVHAANYLPLVEGSSWEYVVDAPSSGSAETLTIFPVSTLIFDVETPTFLYAPSTANHGLRQFWDCEIDGDVILRGFHREFQGVSVVYEPAFEFVNVPLFVGKTWISSVETFSYPELEPTGSLTIEFEVLSEEVVGTPAGDFLGFQIVGSVLFGEPHPIYGVAGHAGSGIGGMGPFPRWWTNSIGLVQYDAGETLSIRAVAPRIAVGIESETRTRGGDRDSGGGDAHGIYKAAPQPYQGFSSGSTWRPSISLLNPLNRSTTAISSSTAASSNPNFCTAEV